MTRSERWALTLVVLVLCLVFRGAGARAEKSPVPLDEARGQCVTPIELSLPGGPAMSGLAGSVPSSFFEDFEGDWPPEGWAFVDNMAYSDYWLGARACYPMEGQKAGWLHGGGTTGSRLGCGYWYPSNLETWARYGPFDLSQAVSSELTFYLFGETEYDGDGDCTDDDYMFLGASTEAEGRYGGHVFCGAWEQGDQPNGYYRVSFDLSDYLGQPEVYFAFVLITDCGANARGFHVDNLALHSVLATPTVTPTPSNTPTITPTPSNTPIPRLRFGQDSYHVQVGEEAWIEMQICHGIESSDFCIDVAFDPALVEVLDGPDGPVVIGQYAVPLPVFINGVREPGLLGYAGQNGGPAAAGCGLFGKFQIRGLAIGEFDLSYPQSYFGVGHGEAMVITDTCHVWVGPATPTSTPDPAGDHHLALALVRRDLAPTATPTLTPEPTSTYTPEPTLPLSTSTPTQPPATLPPTVPPDPTPSATMTVIYAPTVAPEPTPSTTPTVWTRD